MAKLQYFNDIMLKTKIIIIFLFLSSLVFSQIQSDTSWVEDDFVKDTTANWHIGFTIGLSTQLLSYASNASSGVGDSILLKSSYPAAGVVVGIVVDHDYSDKLWLRTGLLFNIAKLNVNYNYNNEDHSYFFNYSSMEIPLWLQYAFKRKNRGLSWGSGVKLTMDVSRLEDVDNRLFKLRKLNLMLGTGPSFRWHIKSGYWVNLYMALNMNVNNFFVNGNDIYNQSVKSGRLWQLQLLLALN